jgi:hypothetical protein
MTRSPARRLLFLAFTLSLPTLVLGCPKKQPMVQDAGEAPPPPPSNSVTELAPLGDDGGEEAEAEAAAPKKWVGPAVNPNQRKIQACCNAMRAQAKALGPSSPEGFQINALAAQCDVFAKQVGPAGNAPELAQLRAILKSVTLPSACNF